jgi:protein SCO1/2
MRTVTPRGKKANEAARLLAALGCSILFGLLSVHTSAAPNSGQRPAAQRPAHREDSSSLYELELQLTDQASRARALDLYRGQHTLVTLFYGSCPMACPLLIDTLRATENAMTPQERARVRVLMVSVDPERDTPQALAALAQQRRIDPERWTLARADANDVRLLAAALNIQYRRLPNGEYNHTSVITLLAPDGRMVKQTSVLGRADEEVVGALRTAMRAQSAAARR